MHLLSVLRRIAFFLLLALLFLDAPLYASLRCQVAWTSNLPWQGSPTSELAIEWNAPRKVLAKYLVTKNGRVGGLLPHIKSTPDWLQAWWSSDEAKSVRAKYPRILLVRELPWEHLPLHLQDRLIAYSARAEAGLSLDLSVPVSPEEAWAGFNFFRALGMETLYLRGVVPVRVPYTLSPRGALHVDLANLSRRSTYQSFGIWQDFQVLEPLTTLDGSVISPGEKTNVVTMQEKDNGLIEHLDGQSLHRLLNDKPLDGFQIHFRSVQGQMSPSKFLQLVAHLARTLGDAKPSFHAHLVENLPMDLLHTDSVELALATALSMADFLMRANQLEEFRAIKEGHPIILRRLARSKQAIWGTLEAHHFHTLTRSLFHLLYEKVYIPERLNFPYLGDALKSGYVGMHWSTRVREKYDRLDAWGLHLRGLDENTPTETSSALIHALEYQMYNRTFVHLPKHVSSWLDWDLEREEYRDEDVDDLATRVARARWNKPWDILFDDIAKHNEAIANLVDQPFKEWLKNVTEFRQIGDEEHAIHLELKMLLHDSGSEMQYLENHNALVRIRAAKLRALAKIKALSKRRVADMSDEITHIMQTYLDESGEWQHALWSFGLTETRESRIIFDL